MRQLEQEAKLEVGPEWSVPDLADVLPGAQVAHLPLLALNTTYYDTSDQLLSARNMTLRVRQETEAGHPDATPGNEQISRTWTLKLPSSTDGAVLARTEVTWPAEVAPATTTSAAGSGPTSSAAAGTPAAAASPDVDQERGRQGTARRQDMDGNARSTCPSGSGARSCLTVPAEVTQFLAAVSLGRPLAPVANLMTTRHRTEVRTGDGLLLAEIDHDTVTGSCLVGTTTGTVSPHHTAFTEIEVELAEGGSPKALHAIVAKLVANGARPSSRRSKLATVLSSSAPLIPLPMTAPAPRRSQTLVSDALRKQIQACLNTLLEHDPPIRLSDPDPEHVHRSRVATRRLRSVLQALAPLVGRPAESPPAESPPAESPPAESAPAESAPTGTVPGSSAPAAAVPDESTPAGAATDTGTGPEAVPDECTPGPGEDGNPTTPETDPAEAWFTWLRDELRWLGGALGASRDADVRLMSLERRCSKLPEADAEGAEQILDRARHDQKTLRGQLLEIMKTDRYLLLLRSLDAAARPPGTGDGAPVADVREPPPELWSRLSQPAPVAIPLLGRHQWRSLRAEVSRLGDDPPDEALHRVRIHAKRARYLAELATPFLQPASSRRTAARSAKAAAELQDVLGEVHDSAANERWLREVPLAVPPSRGKPRAVVVTTTALAAGQLVSMARDAQRTNRLAWPKSWERLRRKRLAWWDADRR
jgi:CHAD domain-containing protein